VLQSHSLLDLFLHAHLSPIASSMSAAGAVALVHKPTPLHLAHPHLPTVCLQEWPEKKSSLVVDIAANPKVTEMLAGLQKPKGQVEKVDIQLPDIDLSKHMPAGKDVVSRPLKAKAHCVHLRALSFCGSDKCLCAPACLQLTQSSRPHIVCAESWKGCVHDRHTH
jgi:hypothetical protein